MPSNWLTRFHKAKRSARTPLPPTPDVAVASGAASKQAEIAGLPNPIDHTELMMSFESLGDNCEFGVVQRCCGAEPLGLFRFSASSLENMIDVVSGKAELLYTDGDVKVYVEHALNEYCLISRRYGDFPYHSQVDVGSVSQSVFEVKEAKRLSYLKQRFVLDLESGQKIFVRKGLESDQDIQRLHAALRQHGDNWLLWVVLASGSAQAGTVDVLQAGLLRGYVKAYKNFENEQPVDLVSWVAVCREAYSLFQSARNRHITFVSNKTLLEGFRWTVTAPCDADTKGDFPASPSGNTVYRLTKLGDNQDVAPMAKRAMTCAVNARDILVFSAWIWVGHQFSGDRIDVAFENWSDLVSQMADLSKRDCWQLIWVSARVPREGGPLVATLRVRATAGSSFYVSSWTLEEGIIPTPSCRPSGWRRLCHSIHSSAHRLASRVTRRLEPRDAAARLREVQKGGAAWRLFIAAAEAQIAERHFDDADLVLRRAIAAFPGDGDLLKLYAWSAHVSARYAIAVERWRQALMAKPGDPLCHGALAANLREHGSVEDAEQVIQAALPRFPNDIVIVTEAGRIAQARARYDQALAYWDQALDLAGPHPDWVRCRAEAVRALEDARSA